MTFLSFLAARKGLGYEYLESQDLGLQDSDYAQRQTEISR